MTCPQCGTDVPDGSAFCRNCGADLQTLQQAGASSSGAGGNGASVLSEVNAATKERKEKNWPKVKAIISLVVAIVVIGVWIYACSIDGKINYVRSVQEHFTPFIEVGVDYTCGEVLGRYMPDAKWSSSESDGIGHVTVSGPILEASELEIQFDVEQFQDNDEKAYYSVVSGILDGQIMSAPETVEVMATLWDAYDAGLSLQEFEDYYA